MHGPKRISNPKPDYKQWLKDFFGDEGKQWIKKETKRIINKPFRRLPRKIEHNQTVIFEHFDSDESLSRWKVSADSDSYNGFSTGSIIKSPAGHALFKGYLDNRLPDDGQTVDSGAVAMIGSTAPKDSLIHYTPWSWTNYNTFEIKFRGDGRKYLLVVSTADPTNDISYYDAHIYPLHTRGGPYWQILRVPFSKFIFSCKGLIQDSQCGLPVFKVRFVGVLLKDKVDGPFALEIDYMGLRVQTREYREVTAYEQYSFSHLKYRSLQVDAPVPE